nr:MAG: capsid protein precursor [Mamastrovirus 3]
MANNQKNVQPKVVTTTTTTTRRRGGRRRRRNPRTSTSSKTTVRKVAVLGRSRRLPRRRNTRPGNFPKSNNSMFRQKITATLGSVGSNKGNGIELEMSALINPALMKETTGSNQFGPLQIAASTYNFWSVDYIDIKLTPLVGASAVSGTMVRTSLNLAAQPGSPSWSALGARKHKDTSPGKPMTFRIKGSDIMGPKEGWFCCNTKNDPQMCLGGSIEIHTFGKTMSTYKSDVFDGPLFLAEVIASWRFKNYNPQPGMLNLIKAETTEPEGSVKINATPGEPITISVPNDSSFARTIAQADLGVAADATASEIIWQVCDTTVDVVEGVLPPPFQWLIKAGWWFLKRIVNKKKTGAHVEGQPDANEVTFQLYQSMSDAMNDVPCLATGPARSTNILTAGWSITQVTPGNVGQSQDTGNVTRAYEPTLDPIQIVSDPDYGKPALCGHIFKTVPISCFAAQEVPGTPPNDRKVYSYIAWQLDRPIFLQNGKPVDPTQIQSYTYPIFAKQNLNYRKVGDVYAADYVRIGSSDPYHWTTLLWKASTTETIELRGNNNTATDMYVFIQPNQVNPPSAALPQTDYSLTTTSLMSFGGGHVQRVQITAGNWYLSSFVAYGGRKEFENYGVPFYHSTNTPTTTSTPCEPDKKAFDVGAVMQTTQPVILTPPAPGASNLTALEVAQLRQLLLPRDNHPPSDNDNLEMPPLEGEEEELQGAVGGTEKQGDIKNWVEFGHRKRPPTPFSPIEEEEEDEEESDLDDDDYAEVPSYIKNLLTLEAKKLLDDLKKMGLSHEKAVRAAQGAYPHPAAEVWEEAYHNALVDGLSPPSARDCAWGAVSDYLP